MIELTNAKTIIERTAKQVLTVIPESELDKWDIVILLIKGLEDTFPCE